MAVAAAAVGPFLVCLRSQPLLFDVEGETFPIDWPGLVEVGLFPLLDVTWEFDGILCNDGVILR